MSKDQGKNNEALDKAVKKYVIYVFGETTPLSRREEILNVEEHFTRGWMNAKVRDEFLLDQRAGESLRRFRRPGA